MAASLAGANGCISARMKIRIDPLAKPDSFSTSLLNFNVMKKLLFASCLVAGAMTIALQSCQKSDAGLLSQGAVKVAPNPGNDLGASDRECGSCQGTLQTTINNKGPYNAIFESKACELSPWANPYFITSSSSNNQSFPLSHDLMYKVRVQNLAAYPRTMSFVIAQPPYPSMSTGSFTVPAMVGNITPGVAEAVFSGRSNCGCDWRYGCPADEGN